MHTAMTHETSRYWRPAQDHADGAGTVSVHHGCHGLAAAVE